MGRRQLLPYCLVSGSMSLGYGSIYTLLADLRDRFGFSGTQLGVIVAAGFFAGFCAQLFLARYADRGHITFMVRGGVVVAALAMFGCAVASEFWAFVLARLLLGLGSGAVGPAIRRIVITRDPDAGRRQPRSARVVRRRRVRARPARRRDRRRAASASARRS